MRKSSCAFCGKDDFADTRPSTIGRHESICLSNPERKTKTRPGVRFRRVVRLRLRQVPRDSKFSARGAEETKNYHASEYPLMRGVPNERFSVVLMDPPFSYGRTVGQGVACAQYETMTDDELRSLPVRRISAKNAILLLWCSGPTMDRAIALVEAWGFSYKTVGFVWVKTNKGGTPQSMGLGSYTLPGTEFVLLATRGQAAPLIHKRVNQVILLRRSGHSVKPKVFRAIIHEMLGKDPDLKKIELFSRHAADDDWSVWGNELDKNPDTF